MFRDDLYWALPKSDGLPIKDNDLQKAEFFLGKSDLLFALSVDFPGLTKMPLAYMAAAKAELKRLGWLLDRGWKQKATQTYRVFFLGPRVKRGGHGRPCSTAKRDATGFKIYFYSHPWRPNA